MNVRRQEKQVVASGVVERTYPSGVACRDDRARVVSRDDEGELTTEASKEVFAPVFERKSNDLDVGRRCGQPEKPGEFGPVV